MWSLFLRSAPNNLYGMDTIVLAYNAELAKAEYIMQRNIRPLECIRLWNFLILFYKLETYD